jgi:hypothetical protein
MDALLSIPVAYRWLATLAFIGIIIALSVTPGVERPDDNLFSWLYINTSTPVQKALHIISYAVLAALWMWTLAGITSIPARLATSFALSFCLGIALEWYQTTVPGRFGTVTDVILNTIGTIAGLILAVLLL